MSHPVCDTLLDNPSKLIQRSRQHGIGEGINIGQWSRIKSPEIDTQICSTDFFLIAKEIPWRKDSLSTNAAMAIGDP